MYLKYSSFNAHQSGDYPNGDFLEFKNEIVQTESVNQGRVKSDEGVQNSTELDALECIPPESVGDTGEFQAQLRKNLAS